MRKASAKAADAFPLLIQLIVKSLHPLRRFLPHGLGHMAVDIQSELCRRMAQVCLDGLDIIACVEGGDGEGVSEVVEAGFLHTGTLGDLFKVLDHGAPNQVLANGIGEHQIHGIAPAGSGEGFGSLLLLLLLLQSLHDHGSREDGAASAAFGRLEEVFSVLALELLLDGDDAGKEGCVWTIEDDLLLRDMFEDGDDVLDMALMLERKEPAVQQRIDQLELYSKQKRTRTKKEISADPPGCLCRDCKVDKSLCPRCIHYPGNKED